MNARYQPTLFMPFIHPLLLIITTFFAGQSDSNVPELNVDDSKFTTNADLQ